MMNSESYHIVAKSLPVRKVFVILLEKEAHIVGLVRLFG